MTPSSGRIDTCPTFCVALCWRDPGSPSQPLLSLSACCHPPGGTPSRAQDPREGARPWHLPLCCIPPPPAWGAWALPEGATSAAPGSHTGAPLAASPGWAGDGQAWWVSTEALHGPAQRGFCSCLCADISPFSRCPGCPSLPACLLHPPLWSSLGSI